MEHSLDNKTRKLWLAVAFLSSTVVPRVGHAWQHASALESAKRVVLKLEDSGEDDDPSKAIAAAYELMGGYLGPAFSWSGPYGPKVMRIFPQEGRDDLLPRLVRLLDAPNDNVAGAAADLLGTIGRGSESAISPLRRVALDLKRSYSVRSSGAIAMLYATPARKSVVADMFVPRNAPHRPEFEVSQYPMPNSKVAQKQRLLDMGRTVVPLGRALRGSGHTLVEVPTLVKLASEKDNDSNTRVMATILLGELEEEAEKALDDLHRLLTDEDPLVKAVAASSIIQIDREAKSDLLADRAGVDKQDREEFVDRLDFIAQHGREEREMLRQGAPHVLPVYMLMMEHGLSSHRRCAIRCVRDLGEAGRPARASLLRCIETAADEQTRNLAKEVLKTQDGD